MHTPLRHYYTVPILYYYSVCSFVQHHKTSELPNMELHNCQVSKHLIENAIHVLRHACIVVWLVQVGWVLLHIESYKTMCPLKQHTLQ